MTTEHKPAPDLPAGAAMLGTFPLGLMLAFLFVGSAGLLEALQRGGLFAWLVVVGALPGSVAAAFIAAHSPRTPALPLPAVLAPSLALLGVGAVGVRVGWRQVSEAVSVASPAQRAVLQAAGLSEVLQLERFALIFALAACACALLAGLVALRTTPERLSHVLGLAGIPVLTVGLLLRLVFTTGLMSLLSTLANVAPEERAGLLAAGDAELRTWLELSRVALGAAALGGLGLTIALRQLGQASTTGQTLVILAAGLLGTTTLIDSVAPLRSPALLSLAPAAPRDGPLRGDAGPGSGAVAPGPAEPPSEALLSVGQLGATGPQQRVLVRERDTRVRGALDVDLVRRVLRQRFGEPRYCFERESLSAAPPAPGEVTVQFEVGPEGRASAAQTLANTTGSAAVASCLAERIERWLFPSTREGVSVTTTLRFTLRE